MYIFLKIIIIYQQKTIEKNIISCYNFYYNRKNYNGYRKIMKEKTQQAKKENKKLNKQNTLAVEPSKVENVSTAKENNKRVKKRKLRIKPKHLRTPQSKAKRINAPINLGLSEKEADQRYVDGLSNIVKEKYSKSIFSIIICPIVIVDTPNGRIIIQT